MNSTKALPATTIIPDHLYVEREADRQLNGVIEEMGRPGYVLVARQMGKTNLLLRMKRSREKLGDVVLYMDLSTHYENARDLFRSIIDNLLELTSVSQLEDRIIRDRTTGAWEPNVEYDKHLRSILGEINGKRVVIVLDEIDSLVGKSFSDRILSQIRSMYFARANYVAYNALTYVLSGVAEPTDLIKDKNISPFNIGEKIYLSDFSLSEVRRFLVNAGLIFSPEVVEAIYNWCGGNPRMTWDISAALEDLARAGEKVSATSVNSVVQRLYLERFDRAPLDHIRALAETDGEIRNALIALLYGKGDILDDRSRSRLYLAGITTGAANQAPRIKNRIIEHALSEAWLAQIEAGKDGLLEAAAKRFKDKDYKQAIALTDQYLGSDGKIEDLSDASLMDYGLSHYNLANLSGADRALSIAVTKTRSSELRIMIKFHLATVKQLSGNAQDALPLLDEVANTPNSFQLQAMCQLGNTLAALDSTLHYERIISITDEVLRRVVSDEDLEIVDAAVITIAAHYNLARVHLAAGNDTAAQDHLNAAVDPRLAAVVPGVAFMLLDERLDHNQVQLAVVAAAQAVLDGRLHYSPTPDSFAFNERGMSVLLALAFEGKQMAQFEGLLEIAMANSGLGCLGTLIELAEATVKPGFNRRLAMLMRWALGDNCVYSEATSEEKIRAHRFVFGNLKGAEREGAFADYWRHIKDPQYLEHFSEFDAVLLLNRVGELMSSHRLLEAENLMSFAKTNVSLFIEKSTIVYAVFIFYEMNLRAQQSNDIGAQACAREILSLLDSKNLEEDPLVKATESLVIQLRDRAREILNPQPTLRTPLKFGRNEFVIVRDKRTGVQTRVKFKKVSDRLASGDLEIVENYSNIS